MMIYVVGVVGACALSSAALGGTVVEMAPVGSEVIRPAPAGVAELSVQLMDAGPGLVDVRLVHAPSGDDASPLSASGLWFGSSGDVFQELVSIDDSLAGVSLVAAPATGPAAFDFAAAFGVTADPASDGGGVGAGEWATVRLSLRDGLDAADVLAAMAEGLRIAAVVDGGVGATLYVTRGAAITFDTPRAPLAPAAWLGAAGLAGVALGRRRASSDRDAMTTPGRGR